MYICDVINNSALGTAAQPILMFSAISFILFYHPNLDCMEMDARRQPIDRPGPAQLIYGVLAILRSQGFA